MKKLLHSFLCVLLVVVLSNKAAAQASVSGNTMAESRFAATPINTFTGMPSLSVPIFSYSHPAGVGAAVSLDYFAGGIKLNEKSTTVGLGWSLSAGGVIMRTVRGMPDDFPVKGFMYAGPVPANYPSMGAVYFQDSIDAEQDVFQLSTGDMACQFFIGKNKQIVVLPLSKIKITYQKGSPDTSRITSFTVSSTTGVKYVFNELEQTTNTSGFGGAHKNIPYTTAWHLRFVIAPFGTDTIKYTYQTIAENNVEVPFGQEVNVQPNGGAGTVAKPLGMQNISFKKIAAIQFPDNKSVQFVYDSVIKYDGMDVVLNRIKIYDSIFRYGYLLDRDSISPTMQRGHAFLTGVRYFTNTYVNTGYKFTYNIKYNPAPRNAASTFNNRRDHWGFYNGIDNPNHAIPATTGPFGTYTGANRQPIDSLVGANTISSVTDASGGTTHYLFEPNDVYNAFNIAPQYFLFNGKARSNNSISIAHALNNKDSFTVSVFNKSRYNAGVDPVSGNIIFSLTNADSSIVYYTGTFNLDTLLWNGFIGFSCTNLPNGTVYFKSKLASGAVVNLSVFNLNLSWDKYTSSGQSKTTAGGIRVKYVLRYDPVTNNTDTIATYKYVRADGKSSGFANAAPIYTHAYQEINETSSSTITTNYTTIYSDPVNNLTYSQGSPVGYRRVEIIKGTPTRNLGRQVYEYTAPLDTISPADIFPYAPVAYKSWMYGLPQKVSVYDSLNRLLQTTTNTFSTTNNNYNNDNFKSCRLGVIARYTSQTIIDIDELYLGAFYYVQSGRTELLSVADTFYHPDSSTSTSKKDIVYDTNYNPIKTIVPYDKTRGLSMESRIYYPYNYTIAGTIGKLRDSSIYIPVSTENWITGDATPRMLSAQITDFTQLPKGYIRPLATYALQAAAPVPQATIGAFNPAVLIRNNAYFIKQQNFTQYDGIANLLETQNALSLVYNTVIMDYDSLLPVATISNAKYADVAYTSFEADGKGNWAFSSTARDTLDAVTGRKSYVLTNGAISKIGLTAAVTYIITYWRKSSGTVSIPNTTGSTLIASQNGWDLYTQNLTGQTSVTISGTASIDELRLYPNNANMASSTYEPVKGLTSSCGADNTIAYNEYDPYNRLKAVRDRNKNIRSQYDYPNNVTAITTAPNWKATGKKVCQFPYNGTQYREERDSAYYSETYMLTRMVVHTTSCNACTRSCTLSTYEKPINCLCEMGVRYNDYSNYVSIYNSITGLYEWWWQCTFHMEYSDGSVEGPFYEYSNTPCSVQ